MAELKLQPAIHTYLVVKQSDVEIHAFGPVVGNINLDS